MPGRSKRKKDKEEDEGEESHERLMRGEVTRGIMESYRMEADAVRRGVTWNTVPVTQDINVKDSYNISELRVKKQEEWKEIEQRRRQQLDCSQNCTTFSRKRCYGLV